MVYLGPSRGCVSCRKRRRKCDQTRPCQSCMRCIKANRTCGGYEDRMRSTFRQYEAYGANPLTSFISTARKCTLPRRTPAPGTDVLPNDKLPLEASEAYSNDCALRGFFYDYCVIPINRNLSRGFFSSLEITTHRLGPKSDLSKACQAIGYGCGGKTLLRPRFALKAEMYHQELLKSFARAIESPVSASANESKLIATLLGLYQIAMASKSDPGNHDAHAKGIAALMNIAYSPLNLLGTARSSHTSTVKESSKISKISGVFSVPALTNDGESLDGLLLDLESLWMRFETLFGLQEFNNLRYECMNLERRFAKWQESRGPEITPITIGHIDRKQDSSEIAVGYWPGKVYTYFDLYVAGVWNIFRTARLLLITLIINLSEVLGNSNAHEDQAYGASCIVEEIIASIPYHITDNLPIFVREQATTVGITDRGRALGGLLLIHPLYVVSNTPFLAAEVREYSRRCLAWIGSAFGIGQATLFAETSDIDMNYLASGCMIVWSGFVM